MFYKNNTTHAYKDRHWLDREFSMLTARGRRRIVLEVGCGVGNTIFPMLRLNPDLYVYGVDFSSKAIEFVRANPEYDETRVQAFTMDLTCDAWPSAVPLGEIDMITCLYVLSAVHPDRCGAVIQRMFDALAEGGHLYFRDYGRYDQAQLRFKLDRRLGDNFYARQNGTRSYYFALEELAEMFSRAGFEIIQNEYCLRTVSNRKTGVTFTRVWIQAKLLKPYGPVSSDAACGRADA